MLCNTFPDDTGAMTTIVEGFSWVVERPRPGSDVAVAAFTCHADGEVERLVRVVGLDRTDYMQLTEARALARALDAAANQLAR